MLKYFLLTIATCMSLSLSMSDYPYTKKWKEVEDFMNQRQPKSALTLVEEIYQQAAIDKEEPQQLRAILYKYRLAQSLEEVEQAALIQRLEAELEVAQTDELQAMLESVLSAIYKSYASQNAYRLGDRMRLGNLPSDVTLWAVEDIEARADELAWQSTQHQELEKVELENYQDLFDKNQNIANLTLQSFVLMQGIKHFRQRGVSSFHDRSNVTKSEAMSVVSDFLDISFATSNLQNRRDIALYLYQQLLRILNEGRESVSFAKVNIDRFNTAVSFFPGDSMESPRAAKENDKIKFLIAEAKHAQGEAKATYQFDLADTYVHTYSSHHLEGQEDRSGYKTALEILNQIKTQDSDLQKAVKNQIEYIYSPELQVTGEEYFLPEHGALLNVHCRNIEAFYGRVVALSPEEYFEYKHGMYHEHVQAQILRKSPYQTFSNEVNIEEDHQLHNMEVVVPPLPAGQYAILINSKDDWSSKKNGMGKLLLAQATNVDVMHLGVNQILLTERMSAAPIVDAKVHFAPYRYSNKSRAQEINGTLGIKSSDLNGIVSIPKVRQNQVAGFVKYQGTTTVLDQLYYRDHHHRDQERAQVVTYLDRSIYRPGQTVSGHIMTYRNVKNGKPVKLENATVSVRVTDANYQEVTTQSVVTDDYGSAMFDFTLPTDGLKGQYRIQLEVEGSRNTKVFRVEEYRRPTLEGEWDTIEELYVLGDEISLSGSGKSLSGFPIQNAEVSYEVRESSMMPYYRYNWYRCWIPPYAAQDKLIKTGSTSTDLDGKFTMSFLSDDQVRSSWVTGKRYTIKALIKDKAGESVEIVKHLSVCKKNYRIEHNIPTLVFDQTDLSDIKIEGKNLDDKSVTLTAEIDIRKYEESKDYLPERRRVPSIQIYSEDEWADANVLYDYNIDESPKLNKRIIKQCETATLAKTLKGLKHGTYQLTINTTGPDGETASADFNLLIAGKEKQSPSQLLYNESTASLRVGESFDPEILIHEAVAQVYYRIYQSDRQLESGWLSREEFVRKSWDVTPALQGGFTLEVFTELKGIPDLERIDVEVPYEDSLLDIDIASDSILLPGTDQNVTFTSSIEGKEIGQVKLATVMYDAALDALYPHTWNGSFLPVLYGRYHMAYQCYRLSHAHRFQKETYPQRGYYNLSYMPNTYWWNATNNWNVEYLLEERVVGMKMPMPRAAKKDMAVMDEVMVTGDASPGARSNAAIEENNQPEAPKPRSEFGETVFFTDDLVTGSDGRVDLDFKTNDALTKWKILVFGHDKDFRYGFAEKELRTQQDIQIVQNPTRNLIAGDKVDWPVTVQNSGDATASGTATVRVTHLLTGEDLTTSLISNPSASIDVESGRSAVHTFRLDIPDGFTDPLKVETAFVSDAGSDAEVRELPVLSASKFLTEGTSLWVSPQSTSIAQLETLDVLSYADAEIEITTNPLWLVARSFPMMTDLNSRVTSTLIAKIFTESVASEILEKFPEVEKAYAQELIIAEGTPLNRNQDLKAQLLNNTPWVLNAQRQEERVADFARYFNRTQSATRLSGYYRSLIARQNQDGGLPWINGGRSSYFMTLQALIQLVRLKEMGISSESIYNEAWFDQAMQYLDREAKYEWDRMDKKYLSYTLLGYTYLHALMPDDIKPVTFHNRLLNLLSDDWTDYELSYQAVAGLIFHHENKTTDRDRVYTSLQEREITREDGTIFWKEINDYYRYSNRYATQALVLRFYSVVNSKSPTIDKGSQWLLANKRSNEWYNHPATSDVIYFLYQHYGISIDSGEKVSLSINGRLVALEHGLTYSKANLESFDLQNRSEIKIKSAEDYPVFAGIFRQYFHHQDKVEQHGSQQLSIDKALFVKSSDKEGEVTYVPLKDQQLRPGDEVRVRLTVESFDRMSYVYISDQRLSGAEPVDALSTFDYRNGLYLYQSPSDVGQEFFVEVMPKGVHTLEYDIRLTQGGNFSSGLAQAQSFYVPEFSAFDTAPRVQINSSM